MYTECPDCQAVFCITAHMLQQASGHVICGDCGHAFNALERLSEDSPDAEENPSALSGTTDEQEKAFLDTLDELSGTDNIRIEDTGVEWRVFDEDAGIESAGPDESGDDDANEPEDTGSVRWYIEDVRSELQDAGNDTVITDAGDEERYDDNTPLPDYLDDDNNIPPPPETPRRREEDRIEPRSPEFDERQVDFALSEPDDWTELLDEVGDGRDVAAPAVADASLDETDIRDLNDAGDEAADDGHDGSRDDVDLPSDIDTQFDLQALELGIDLTGDFDPTGEEPIVIDLAADEVDEQDLATDGAPESKPPDVSDHDDEELTLVADDEQDTSPATADDPDRTEHYVPPQTEEEKTINMLIDRDLLRLAEQEDVFRSTTTDARKSQDYAPHVETIIMEGDFVRHALDVGEPPIEIAAENSIDVAASLEDTYMSDKDRIRGGRRRMDPTSYTIIAGVAVLALLFAAQVVHAYRETLATYGAFDHTVGSVYRLFGAPITPDWNIKGWQFEATNGSTAAYDQVLTISSRIANRSDGALPYPLLHVSLTDRWEEIIGSRILEPDEYLVGRTDPRGNVAPGKKFTAIITIAALSPDATGFKLNVCYRVSGERVRCATGAFKN